MRRLAGGEDRGSYSKTSGRLTDYNNLAELRKLVSDWNSRPGQAPMRHKEDE